MTQATRRKTGGFFRGCSFFVGVSHAVASGEVDMALAPGFAAVGGLGSHKGVP